MWVYFVFDLLAYASVFIRNDYVISGLHFLFPSIQAFGVCFFKSSMDPIARVSALFYHKIISINQAPTKSYWDSMMKEVTIEKKEHQKQLFKEFVEEQSIS